MSAFISIKIIQISVIAFIFCNWFLSAAFCAESITITEVQQFRFATLAKPGSGSQTLTVPRDGSAPTGTGAILYGTSSRGQYNIKRTGSGSSTTCTIDIQNISSGNANLTIGSFLGNYNGSNINSFPASGLARPSNGTGTTLYLGATATYNSSIPKGTYTPSFDIAVTLQ
ncbi:MAG: DUF4402 domain-containing protein [Pseudomonadota bacterium]